MPAGSKGFSTEVAKPLSADSLGKPTDDEPKKQTREEWRKKKELDEARKLGNAPAEVDEEGKDINPHIPQYISTVPWYVDPNQRPTLKHQRVQPITVKEFSKIGDWYHRGVPTKSLATKYRKGACENCGAMTHKKKDCLERPRKIGAKFTGNMIAPDEFVQPDLQMDYDGKRDRWNGFQSDQHKEVIEEYAKIEIAKQALKAQKLQEELLTGKMTVPDEEENNSDDEDKYADTADMPGQNFDSKRRITVRNLRIREDTAKYLRNLDPDSAYYDPKTRSMRENPYRNTGKQAEELDFAGDNFVRHSGDTQKMASMQMFAWEAAERGVDVHLQADPTRLEMLQDTYGVRKKDFKKDQRDSILEKYGGTEHLDAPPKELLHAQTEDYVEYSRHGTVIKGLAKAKTKSKYVENVYINNHVTVWGSYWSNGQWGFACCKSTIKQSYCVGNSGVKNEEKIILPQKEPKQSLQEKHSAWTKALGLVDQEATEEGDDEPVIEETGEMKSMLQQHRENLVKEEEEKKQKKRDKQKRKKKRRQESRKRRRKSSSSEESEQSSSSDSDLPEEKQQQKKLLKETEKEKQAVEKAIKKEKQRQRQVDRVLRLDERKRPYNSMMEIKEPTKDEMEAYHKIKKNTDDPMCNFMK